jgi:hypothetical protein
VVVDVAVAEPVHVALILLHQSVERLALAPLARGDGIAVIPGPP